MYVLKTIVNKFINLALSSNVIPVKSECEKHKNKFLLCLGVLRVFVLLSVLVFVRAILSWCS